MKLVLFQVDAFSDQLFGGNPAAVVPLKDWSLSDDMLQAIAAENNLSETAFFVDMGAHYHLRWFTPAKEVRLCGHATLATAHVLFSELGYKKDEIVFQSLGGELRVNRTPEGYRMDFPTDAPRQAEEVPVLEEILGVPVLETWRGQDDYLVRIDNQQQLDALQPDFRKLAAVDTRGLIVTTTGTETDIASRAFFPAYGIDEDPVTGSAHTLLTPFWAKQLNKKIITAVQGGPRKGRLQCELLSEERVAISGPAVTYLKGELAIEIDAVYT